MLSVVGLFGFGVVGFGFGVGSIRGLVWVWGYSLVLVWVKALSVDLVLVYGVGVLRSWFRNSLISCGCPHNQQLIESLP